MDKNAVFVATCLAAAIASAMMGLISNYPIALAAGMGLNAHFAFVVDPKFSCQIALGAMFVSGILFFILSVLPVREWIINSIRKSLKMAISAGIGLFLGVIGLQACGFVVDHPVTLVTHGDFTKWPVILAGLGFAAMIALDHDKVPGGIIIGVLAVTVVAMLLGLQKFGGIASAARFRSGSSPSCSRSCSSICSTIRARSSASRTAPDFSDPTALLHGSGKR